jgi:tetratricopeptide (TPR) repeat protein
MVQLRTGSIEQKTVSIAHSHDREIAMERLSFPQSEQKALRDQSSRFKRPDDHDLVSRHIDRALELRDQSRFDEVVGMLQRALLQFPKSIRIQSTLINALIDVKRYAEALELGKSVLEQRELRERKPHHAAILTNCGIAERELGNPDQAKEFLLASAELDPLEPLVPFHLGRTYRLLNQDEKAATLLMHALALVQPTHTSASVIIIWSIRVLAGLRLPEETPTATRHLVSAARAMQFRDFAAAQRAIIRVRNCSTKRSDAFRASRAISGELFRVAKTWNNFSPTDRAS